MTSENTGAPASAEEAPTTTRPVEYAILVTLSEEHGSERYVVRTRSPVLPDLDRLDRSLPVPTLAPPVTRLQVIAKYCSTVSYDPDGIPLMGLIPPVWKDLDGNVVMFG